MGNLLEWAGGGGALIEDLRYFRFVTEWYTEQKNTTSYPFDALWIEVFFPDTIFRDNEQGQVFLFSLP